MKEFVKFGFKFVKKRYKGVKKFILFVKKNDLEAEESDQLSQQVDSNVEETVSDADRDQEMLMKTHGDQVDDAVHPNTVAEASNNNPESPVIEEQTAVGMGRNKRRKRSKRSKEKRQDRLLKFHQKLVEVSGLPPSRLMVEQTPKSNRVKLNRRRLDLDMASNNCDLTPGMQEPPWLKPDIVTSFGSNEAGITSNLNCYSMLCSSSTNPSQVSYGNNAGGSDARPQQWMTDWNYPHHFQQGSTGVSSGYMQQPSLCSSPFTCLVWNPPVFQAQPTPSLPPSGQPTYCSSCMMFGNVFTVSPVEFV